MINFTPKQKENLTFLKNNERYLDEDMRKIIKWLDEVKNA
jgi:hypothetical protein